VATSFQVFMGAFNHQLMHIIAKSLLRLREPNRNL